MLHAYGQGRSEEDGHEDFKMEYLDQLAPPLSKQFTMPPLGINVILSCIFCSLIDFSGKRFCS